MDNGGSEIKDQSGTNCFKRINSNYGPKEFGARGNGSDDSSYLNAWLSAVPAQPHIGDVGKYTVKSPLSCSNESIQGPATNNAGGAAAPNPLFEINADNSFAGGPAIIAASNYCRLSGVGVNAKTTPATATGSVTLGSNLVMFTGAISTGAVLGIAVTGADIPKGAVVTGFQTTWPCSMANPCVVLSQNATGSNAMESVTFAGFDAVDVLGTHVLIDGHSLIEQGFFNVNCTAGMDGLRLNDSQFIQSYSDNIYMPGGCANTRMIADIISGAGGEGVNSGSEELTIADGVIEQSAGTGLDLNGASKVTIANMFFDDNGKSNPTGDAGPGILVNSVNTLSICGNHFTGNGGEDAAASQIRFSRASHGVVFCGNAYASENQSSYVALKPAYVYDMDTSASLTDTHFYESPPTQAFGVYANDNAKAALQPLHVPLYTQSQFNGLTLANHTPGTPSAVVDIGPGSAADSTNSALLTLPQTCTVNLAASNGPGALDTGTVHQNTTYYFFIIGTPGAASASGSTTCMASASMTPSFTHTAFNGTAYLKATHGWTESGNPTVYNVGSIDGVIPGQAIDSPDSPDPIAGGTTVKNFSTTRLNGYAGSWSTSVGTTTVTITSGDISAIHIGMAISDIADSTQCFDHNNTVASINVSAHTLTVYPAASCDSVSAVPLQLSSENEIDLSQAAVATTPTGSADTGSDLDISVGLFRLVGALYTNSGDTNVVQFHQDGDTFYLNAPAVDIDSNGTPITGHCLGITFSSSQISCPLSVPKGIQVEAFGRMLGGTATHYVLISNQETSPGTPTVLDNSSSPSQSPGFATDNSLGNTAFPFRITTDTSGTVRIRASGGTNKVFEDTDGWVFHRAQ